MELYILIGVPIKTGSKHVSEIATMALDLQHHLGHIDHQKKFPLQIRVGIHTGEELMKPCLNYCKQCINLLSLYLEPIFQQINVFF